MKVVADTGPLVAAANRRDEAHRLAAALVSGLGRDPLIPDLVLVEVDQLLRRRVAGAAARGFLAAIAAGEHRVVYPTAGLLRRAVEFDARYADLGLGLADGSVMAVAERHNLPILTFDFEDFRATRPGRGYWRLVVDESGYLEATSRWTRESASGSASLAVTPTPTLPWGAVPPASFDASRELRTEV